MPSSFRDVLGSQAKAARTAFLAAIDGANALATQQTLMKECVASNRDTAFGREHDFARIKTLEDYRRAVPIRHYEGLEPWISRSADGEEQVLTAEEPIRFWRTTGTTSASKKIPVTPSAALRTMQGFLALQGTQLHYHPEINERRDTTLVTYISPKAVKQFCGPRKVPYCSTTEAPIEIKAGRESLVAPWMPRLQRVVEDDSVRLYYLLCYAAVHDLYNITCLHPSRFQTITTTLQQKWQDIVRELREGTVLGEKTREPAPERASALERIGHETGTLRPTDLWPNLTFVASWSGGYIARYKPLIERSFCAGFLPMPSISSEAFATMTIDEDPIAQPLNLLGGIFEFVPSEQKVDAGTDTLQFDELEPGQCYEVVVTTLGGLYRYAMCDIFKVSGFIGRVPRLEYYGRRSVSDLTGEKLAEEQAEIVVTAGLRRCGVEAAVFAVCGVRTDNANERPGYVLVVEGDTPDWPGSKYEQLAEDLDRQLRTMNSRYELKRNFGDLRRLEVKPVSLGTFGRYRERLVRRGMPAGQLKDKVLHEDGGRVLSELLELSNVRSVVPQ
jgi:hypothetical protein